MRTNLSLPRIADLTIGQVLGLLQLHGGEGAAAVADDLRRGAGARATPDDHCWLTMQGLAFANRGEALRLTGEGQDLARQVLGD